ncbi:hypothetical protein B0H15DRAFT_804281 [Mycena belliarum]|uniref:Uncharacterized protein n=1 Tax=Mycena belliarum TaxID=1033014 RepID=A0AAD6XM69_9AGAR|nr:hypothetical protein B0H15DRAFT_804281 [Mycena belliae]
MLEVPEAQEENESSSESEVGTEPRLKGEVIWDVAPGIGALWSNLRVGGGRREAGGRRSVVKAESRRRKAGGGRREAGGGRREAGGGRREAGGGRREAGGGPRKGGHEWPLANNDLAPEGDQKPQQKPI